MTLSVAAAQVSVNGVASRQAAEDLECTRTRSVRAGERRRRRVRGGGAHLKGEFSEDSQPRASSGHGLPLHSGAARLIYPSLICAGAPLATKPRGSSAAVKRLCAAALGNVLETLLTQPASPVDPRTLSSSRRSERAKSARANRCPKGDHEMCCGRPACRTDRDRRPSRAMASRRARNPWNRSNPNYNQQDGRRRLIRAESTASQLRLGDPLKTPVPLGSGDRVWQLGATRPRRPIPAQPRLRSSREASGLPLAHFGRWVWSLRRTC